MTEIVKVEIRQSCGITRSIKAMSHIIPPMSGGIVEHPEHVLAGPTLAQETPERFIERERTRHAVLGLCQPDKSVRQIHGLPGKGQDFFLSHPGMERREHDRLEKVFAGLDEPVRFRQPGEIS